MFRVPVARATAVVFDGQCSLCVRSMRLLLFFDWFHRFVCLDFRRKRVRMLVRCVSAEQFEEQMVLITPLGEIKFGFEAWRYIVRRLPLFFVPAHLLYLPIVSQLGDRFYKMIARSRLGLVHCPPGQCTNTYTASDFELELEGSLLDGIQIANNRVAK
ncbi:MAG: DUF393 domain-containing protein [Anaerolineales bacterium]|nr:DUF393 domain-containing protein [Anaerolineales bacterium]